MNSRFQENTANMIDFEEEDTLGIAVDLTLDRELTDSEDDNLSVVVMTPRNTNRRRPSFPATNEITPNNGGDDSLFSFRRMSTLSLQNALSVPNSDQEPNSEKEKTPVSVASIFSSIAKGITRQFADKKTKNEDNPLMISPVSIVEDQSAHPRSRRIFDNTHQEEIPLFSGECDSGVVEFEEYLRDEEREGKRIPSLCLVEYGSSGAYALDIWTLMHNTIRRELIDLFEIVSVLKSKYAILTSTDIQSLRRWWSFYRALWGQYHSYTSGSLEPMMNQICQIDGRGDFLKEKTRYLRDMREWLDLKLEEITSYIEEFDNLPKGRALTLICMNIDSYGKKIITYFSGLEKLYPPFVESYHDCNITITTECKLLDRMRKSSLFPEMVVALTRWMTTEVESSTSENLIKRRTRWLNSHLFFLERQNLHNYISRYEKNHGSILSQFRSR